MEYGIITPQNCPYDRVFVWPGYWTCYIDTMKDIFWFDTIDGSRVGTPGARLITYENPAWLEEIAKGKLVDMSVLVVSSGL